MAMQGMIHDEEAMMNFAIALSLVRSSYSWNAVGFFDISSVQKWLLLGVYAWDCIIWVVTLVHRVTA